MTAATLRAALSELLTLFCLALFLTGAYLVASGAGEAVLCSRLTASL